MYHVYVIRSLKDGEFYTGYTTNLIRRIEEHNNKNQISTKSRAPLILVYYEWCLSKEDAINRENYLKSGKGKKYIKDRIKHYLADNARDRVLGANPVDKITIQAKNRAGRAPNEFLP